MVVWNLRIATVTIQERHYRQISGVVTFLTMHGNFWDKQVKTTKTILDLKMFFFTPYRLGEKVSDFNIHFYTETKTSCSSKKFSVLCLSFGMKMVQKSKLKILINKTCCSVEVINVEGSLL